ncbi:hypothetical protein RM545_01290 [Zunongwangia sp. F260]|uniref:Glycosyltransferase n=1 Tax=Autumnicola lenta TaxID=3075593 RepID=A0ABU3CG29_9FLAO|nr:hypothetical protein [Zunongwangia sp. F260]MDT0645309.1 hypothetical protein [Zunongwangia sp. F260]
MKFLIITQDLRVSGTSAGIGRRSFLGKLKKVYPHSEIDVLYISHFDSSNDDLEILPVDTIIRKVINPTIPFHVKWINRFTSRMFNFLYADHYIHQLYAKHIRQIDYKKYDHIFIWSSGIKHETILATDRLPILKNAIVVFHDPYPHAWYTGKSSKIHKNEFLRLQKMIAVVQQAKTCCATAYYMANDLKYLYASVKKFYTLPHHFEAKAFDFSKKNIIQRKERKLQISYHGALMLGRNLSNVLEAYSNLIQENPEFRKNTEFILRIRGEKINELKQKFDNDNNIKFLDTLDFSSSSNEQMHESDINIILENGPYYCNILPGKVPFLASIGKPVLVISPGRSELRRILKNDSRYIADMNLVEDIQFKLKNLILINLQNSEPVYPFGNYFSDANFLKQVDAILREN